MDKLFLIPFLLTIITLYIAELYGCFNFFFFPLILISVAMFFLCYIFKHYTVSILFISIAISLLIADNFLDRKKDFFLKRNFDICTDEYVTLHGKLLNFPETGKGRSIFLLRITKPASGKISPLNIRIVVQGDVRNFYPGDILSIEAVIKENHHSENFFYNSSITRQLVNNIHFSAFSKSSLLITREKKGDPIMRIVGWLRNRVHNSIKNGYSDEDGTLKREGQMLEALLLGNRRELDPNEKENMLNGGVFHLFAISGTHIGIIAIFVLFFMGKIGSKRRTKYIFLILILTFFLILTGFKVSAQRAVLIAVMVSISKIFYLKSDIINILSLSGMILLTINPAFFLDPGFILTFTVTAGIIAGRRLFLGEQNKKKSPVTELAVANINASIISLPLSLSFFLRYSFSGFAAGMVLLPLTALIMGFALPIIPLSILPFGIGKIPTVVSGPFLKIFFFLTDSFSKQLDMSIFRPPPPIEFTLGFTVLFFITCYMRKHNLLKILSLTGLVIFLFFFIKHPGPYIPDSPEIYFLDVGQGDSQIVVLPNGNSLLIDGGGAQFGDFETGKNIVLPFILKKKIKIKWVAISHFHPDHVRGILEILKIIKPDEVWISSTPENNIFYRSLIKKFSGKVTIKKIKKGFSVENGGVKVKLIFPFRVTNPFQTKNDHSQVITVSYLGMKVLFTGDIEKDAEMDIIKKYGNGIKCDILKVPHHGSKTSSTIEFLRKTKPDYAIFSLGYKNHFGFPSSEVLKRYGKLGIRCFFTSVSGGIKASLTPAGIVFNFSVTGRRF